LTIKRQIARAQANDLKVDITYRDNNKERLNAKAIRYERTVFDFIKSVEAVKSAPVPVARIKLEQQRHSNSSP